MKFEEFNKKYQLYISQLPFEEQLHLAITVCKKLFFDYEDFCSENAFGDSDYLLGLINDLQNGNYSIFNEQTLNDIQKITPDSEDFGDASYAINACSAVYETIEFCKDKNPIHVISIGSCLTDTVDFKIQEEDELSDDEINNHKMMIEARQFLLNEDI